MNPKNHLTQPVSGKARRSPSPRNRFRIDKLEERIAPKKGGHGSFYCFTDYNCTRACGPTITCGG